ncbi:SDR family NAD(P)-dependent oxidoreductase [Streptomyces sp. NPDC057638]|uniref:SDR family NAD(P)-dependent oxidoreductase n=1 Tax=Streptomyces sp. NPDC057638 TaxID=3346190 RepID=UPI00369723D0
MQQGGEGAAARAGLPDLSGQTVLVTGASGLIGRGIAERFALAGAAVVLHYHRDRESATRLSDELRARGHQVITEGADLTDETACAALVERAAVWSGRLTALVNNAGVQPVLGLASMTAAEWRHVLDTNLLGAFACTQAAARVMGAKGGGTVTHIASIEGSQPARLHAHYCASKAALIMHARAAALEYGHLGIRVNTVSPGLIDRPGLSEQWPEGVRRWERSAPLVRRGRAEDIGDACVFLASGMARWVSGHDLVVDGGVSAAPTW